MRSDDLPWSHNTESPKPRRPLRPDEARRLMEEADRTRGEAVKRREAEYGNQVAREQHGDRRDISAWLLVRYTPSDLGLRPIPAGQVFWDSPDIWIESSDPLGNPVAGEPNFVHARVFNLGAFMASPVKVDFYWANPALGLGPGNMVAIGTEFVAIPALTSVDVRCNTPWVPLMVNGGHECVMVNTSCWLIDPITAPFQPTLDRHVGQRNLHVVQAAPGHSISLSLQLTNVFPLAMPARIEARFEHLRILPREKQGLAPRDLGGIAATFSQRASMPGSRLVRALQRSSPAHKDAQRAVVVERRVTKEQRPEPFQELAETRGGTVASRLRDDRGALQASRTGAHAGRLLAALDAFRGDVARDRPRAVTLQETVLEPNAFRMLDAEIVAPPNARSGDVVVVHITHEAGPVTAGGYTVVMQIR